MVKYNSGLDTWGPPGKNPEFEILLKNILNIPGIILDVGCGEQKITNSVVGVDPYVDTDVKAYMWEMPFEDESINAILSFHSLEHVSKYQVLPTLAEFARVLKKDAPLIIVVPDLLSIIETFLITEDVEKQINWQLDTIFGNQKHGGEYHRTGFTEEIFKKYFSVIETLELVDFYFLYAYNQENIGVIARKV